ncbi:hypothetical protein CHU92_14085 [Flavobacterium cyanobacteriorum]|uniref:Uncharacterized protein n=1 Tax=Flavobacterium cyanobacteriorum TaxID=2022802 RepID=A0A255YSN4_9FLAO|nr:hypothetical protein [Flavobacterium cyanobacteriorum]OYQ32213.1 hypothetical protein CHU92_14085 [Flavobacterium cyanobacteriorum]
MKKIFLILLAAVFFAMCKSKKTAAPGEVETITETAAADVQYRDDFRAASAAEKAALLKELRAVDAGYSVIIFTKGYKGEKLVVSTAGKTIYSGNFISNLKTGIAGRVRIQNTADTRVFDDFTKNEAVISAEEAAKHKFIYLMKDTSRKGNPFMITYSNTLRPLK